MEAIEPVEEWAWSMPGAEKAYGPFECREFAIADAQDELPEGGEIVLGHPSWPDPGEYAAEYLSQNTAFLLESMDELATEDGFYSDDDIFALRVDSNTVDADMREMITAWARRCIKATQWTFEEAERIEIPAKQLEVNYG